MYVEILQFLQLTFVLTISESVVLSGVVSGNDCVVNDFVLLNVDSINVVVKGGVDCSVVDGILLVSNGCGVVSLVVMVDDDAVGVVRLVLT